MSAAAGVTVLRVDRFSLWLPQLSTAVAAIGGVERAELLSKARTGWLVQLRRAMIVAGHDVMRKSYPLIGAELGGRNHSTMIDQYRKAKTRRAVDPEFAVLLDTVLHSARIIAGCAPRDMTAADIGVAAPFPVQFGEVIS